MKLFPRLRGIGAQREGDYIASITNVGSIYCDGVAEKDGIVYFYRMVESFADHETAVNVMAVPMSASWSMIDTALLDLVTEMDLYDEAVDQSSKLGILRRRLEDDDTTGDT